MLIIAYLSVLKLCARMKFLRPNRDFGVGPWSFVLHSWLLRVLAEEGVGG
jgi:hypothetical protein